MHIITFLSRKLTWMMKRMTGFEGLYSVGLAPSRMPVWPGTPLLLASSPGDNMVDTKAETASAIVWEEGEKAEVKDTRWNWE